MRPLDFHTHLIERGVDHVSLTEDFKHHLYKNMYTGQICTVPREEDLLDNEFIADCCSWLQIELPLHMCN